MRTFLAVVATLLGLVACRGDIDQGPIRILSMKKELTRVSDQVLCDGFTLTSQEVAAYFTQAIEVDENRFAHEAVIFGCRYSGTLQAGAKTRSWAIFPGGAGYLYDGRTINKRFLCGGNCCIAVRGIC